MTSLVLGEQTTVERCAVKEDGFGLAPKEIVDARGFVLQLDVARRLEGKAGCKRTSLLVAAGTAQKRTR